MLVTSPERRLALLAAEAQRVHLAITLNPTASGLNRRELLRMMAAAPVAAGAMAYSGPVSAGVPALIAGIGGRTLAKRAAFGVLKEGALMVASWWVGKKLDEWTSDSQENHTVGTQLSSVQDQRYVGDMTVAKNTTPAATDSERGTVRFDRSRTKSIYERTMERWLSIVEGVPTYSGASEHPEGTGLVVTPSYAHTFAKVHCARDVDSSFFYVNLGAMPTFVGRRSNWVQVCHGNWYDIATGSTRAKAPGFGYQFMDARDLTWSDDGASGRLAVNGTHERYDDSSPPCKPAHVLDETCKAG